MAFDLAFTVAMVSGRAICGYLDEISKMRGILDKTFYIRTHIADCSCITRFFEFISNNFEQYSIIFEDLFAK